MSARRTASSEQSLKSLGVVGEILAEELGTDDLRYHLVRAIPEAWDKPDDARWEAAWHMLDHDTYYAGMPLLRAPAIGLLVGINDALGEFFSGRHTDPQRGRKRAQDVRDMVDNLGRIVEATTHQYTPQAHSGVGIRKLPGGRS